MEDTIYFYLPGMIDNFEINFMLAQRMQDHPDHFYDNVRIGAIYGCPPNAIWNGGRVCNGHHIRIEDYQKFLMAWHGFKIPIRYTWTNPTLEEEDLDDFYCNLVTDMAHNGENEILVNNDLMEDYIRETYPNFGIISSTTKRITDIDALNEELAKDYKLVVVDYDLNNKWDILDRIIHPEKCELLINPICNPSCPYRKEHYKIIGLIQRGLPYEDEHNVSGCPSQKRIPTDIKQLPTFISREDIRDKYIPRGFRHFKIEGRCCNHLNTIEWYLYYMVKPEYQDEERDWLDVAFNTTLKWPNIPTYRD